jgi:hypothetical protein
MNSPLPLPVLSPPLPPPVWKTPAPPLVATLMGELAAIDIAMESLALRRLVVEGELRVLAGLNPLDILADCEDEE